MIARVLLTVLALLLACNAFWSAEAIPDVNLFGVLFLFLAYVVWFYWKEIQSGYAYLGERRELGHSGGGLILIRFAPMLLRNLTHRKSGG